MTRVHRSVYRLETRVAQSVREWASELDAAAVRSSPMTTVSCGDGGVRGLVGVALLDLAHRRSRRRARRGGLVLGVRGSRRSSRAKSVEPASLASTLSVGQPGRDDDVLHLRRQAVLRGRVEDEDVVRGVDDRRRRSAAGCTVGCGVGNSSMRPEASSVPKMPSDDEHDRRDGRPQQDDPAAHAGVLGAVCADATRIREVVEAIPREGRFRHQTMLPGAARCSCPPGRRRRATRRRRPRGCTAHLARASRSLRRRFTSIASCSCASVVSIRRPSSW